MRVAATMRPRLRKTDRICELGSIGLLVICRATTRRTATALEHDFYEHLARDPQLADAPIEITRATAVKPTTAKKLVERAIATRWRDQQQLASAGDPQTAAARAPSDSPPRKCPRCAESGSVARRSR